MILAAKIAVFPSNIFIYNFSWCCKKFVLHGWHDRAWVTTSWNQTAHSPVTLLCKLICCWWKSSQVHEEINSAQIMKRDKGGQLGISRIAVLLTKIQMVMIKMYVLVIALLNTNNNTNNSCRNLKEYSWGLWSFNHLELTGPLLPAWENWME